MKHYVGLDVSNIETSICIVDQEGNIVKEAKVASDPMSIDAYLRKTKMEFESIGLEAGALSHWLVNGLRTNGWSVVCIDTRFMAAILSTNVNKTDRNDARSIANAIRCKNYREVHVKSIESVVTNCLLTARKMLVHQKMQVSGTIRGLLKTFGIKLPKGGKSLRESIKEAISSDINSGKYTLAPHIDLSVIETLLVCYEKASEQLGILDDKLESLAKTDLVIKRLMTHPGVGPVTATAYKAEIDDPKRFKKSRSVGAYLGMTPRQFSSGEIVRQGRVSKNGSREVRALLHEAGVVVVTKVKAKSRLKKWGLKKKVKLKTQKAGMAVGRKIAINLHQMWIKGKDFDPQMDVEDFDYGKESQQNTNSKTRKSRKNIPHVDKKDSVRGAGEKIKKARKVA